MSFLILMKFDKHECLLDGIFSLDFGFDWAYESLRKGLYLSEFNILPSH